MGVIRHSSVVTGVPGEVMDAPVFPLCPLTPPRTYDMARDDMNYEAASKELAERCPPPGSRWRHRKGGRYTVRCGAVIEATLTPAVVYEVDAGGVWVRPLGEFLDGRFTPEDS